MPEKQAKEQIEQEKQVEESISEDQLQRMLATRTKIVKEIALTEESYVRSLETILEVYSKPLTKMSEESEMILTSSEIQKVFNNVQVLFTFNSYFLNNLRQREEAFDARTTRIGDVFLQFAPFFRMYSQYATNFEEVPSYVAELTRSNSRFASFLQTAQTESKNSLGLVSLLVMPIQRIPRYKLLLETLAKNTPRSHDDWEDLYKALDLVSQVAHKINSDIESQQNRVRIQEFESCFTDNLSFIAPTRRLIRHGPLTKNSSTGNQEYEFFLFNDGNNPPFISILFSFPIPTNPVPIATSRMAPLSIGQLAAARRAHTPCLLL